MKTFLLLIVFSPNVLASTKMPLNSKSLKEYLNNKTRHHELEVSTRLCELQKKNKAIPWSCYQLAKDKELSELDAVCKRASEDLSHRKVFFQHAEETQVSENCRKSIAENEALYAYKNLAR